MAERTWEGLEQPILEAVAALEDEKPRVHLRDVVERTGLPAERVKIGVGRLLQTDLLTANVLPGDGDALNHVAGLRLLPRGRQAVGQWPSADPAEAFLQVLAQRIATEDDPEERGRMQRWLDSARQVGAGVTTGVVTAVIQQVTGLR